MGEDRLADRAKEALWLCIAKTGSQCEHSERMKGVLERLAERVAEMAKEKGDLRP
jgi:hypothetical protein